jgi:uncharacterized membrane protein
VEWIFLLGVVTGCRTMTAIAVLCWAAWLRILPEHGWAIWITYLVSALVFTGFALGEYIGDTRANTPSRKDLGPALARVVFGGLVGALAATSIYEPAAGGILAGVLGALAGTWGGYALRMALARRLGRDLPVALAESALAVVLAIVAVAQLHKGVLLDLKRGAV